jgi:hypothetical protein
LIETFKLSCAVVRRANRVAHEPASLSTHRAGFDPLIVMVNLSTLIGRAIRAASDWPLYCQDHCVASIP